MRRRFLLLALVLLLLSTAWAGWELLRRPPFISQDDYNRIRTGMTLEEVGTVLGCEPGDYTEGLKLLRFIPDDFAVGRSVPAAVCYGEWAAYTSPPYVGPDGRPRRVTTCIRVWFDQPAGRSVRFGTSALTSRPPWLSASGGASAT